MLTQEELREEMRVRTEAIRARKDELQARFGEYADDPMVDNALGLSLVGAGAGTIVFSLIKGKRGIWTYVLGGAFVLLGLFVMGGGAMSRRSGRIVEVESAVREQLGQLDPIARAQIVRDMAADTVAPFMRLGRE
jgi:hypothetical protein